MSDGIEALRHRIDSTADLQSVVRTMKALSASNIGQYERAVHALEEYNRTVELGLMACLRQPDVPLLVTEPQPAAHVATGVIVFGTDQGLVGQFNDLLADYVTHSLSALPGDKQVWVVGERMRDRLEDSTLPLVDLLHVPNSLNAVTALVGQLVVAVETARERGKISGLYLYHNRPGEISGHYEPVNQRLLPLDAAWQQHLRAQPWLTNKLPETLGSSLQTLAALIREYLFVSLFRACAESLASENASRLVTMQRAEKNIGEMLEGLTHSYHQLRQEGIDAELFDIVAGFDSPS
ncbi:F0F1 ATP synthase subunit gamma [Thiothrix fructosivorans]|uniref:F0F1 ATP synthase subunit gamma n=1 Tax=Thiothrix fructosivorans TaxID=111770 RepID=A0A8B0SFB2_9GAMM|nr:F0F1 ATP synthase subunit gamma [Thiothrix fructosivorans]MBO0614631.1 F0F1 ATP synthase subunit gamma [Thiothrix fructosivorans]QTX09455.1 F0F1 ATP synthase subunit gamma [Thiothrix fructosivorans]